MGILDNIELLSSLNSEEKSSLEIFCQERILSPWEVLFNRWDDATAMYIVKSGSLQVYNISTILWVVEKDWFVWEMALFSDPWKTRMASVKAITPTKLIVILYFSLNELDVKQPEVMNKIKDIISKRKEDNKNKWL